MWLVNICIALIFIGSALAFLPRWRKQTSAGWRKLGLTLLVLGCTVLISSSVWKVVAQSKLEQFVETIHPDQVYAVSIGYPASETMFSPSDTAAVLELISNAPMRPYSVNGAEVGTELRVYFKDGHTSSIIRQPRDRFIINLTYSFESSELENWLIGKGF